MGKLKKKRIRIVKKKSKSRDAGTSAEVKFELDDFEGELSQKDIDELNSFCNREFQSVTVEDGKTLEECLQDEIERATEYEISSVNGLMDWLALATLYQWNFIKLPEFSPFEQDLLEPSSIENDVKLAMFIDYLVTD